MNTILLAYNDTDSSNRALTRAAELAGAGAALQQPLRPAAAPCIRAADLRSASQCAGARRRAVGAPECADVADAAKPGSAGDVAAQSAGNARCTFGAFCDHIATTVGL